jgi:aspartate carbamoyltransferase catalytic subunit
MGAALRLPTDVTPSAEQRAGAAASFLLSTTREEGMPEPRQWRHKDLLDVTQLDRDDVAHIFEAAVYFQEINNRSVKKVPTLRGRSVVLFFAEPSTRTKTSFDVAGKRLSADTFSLAKSSSSLRKGESLKDTALTLQAMNPDAIVIRHESSGAAQFLADRLECSVINAGDGWHAHPTQALLDAFSLYQQWSAMDFSGKTVLILGDIAHSRVARSNAHLLTMLGAKVRLCGPRTLMPSTLEGWPVEACSDLEKAVKGVHAVMCLRLQLERQQDGLLPDLREYSVRYGLGQRHLQAAAEGAVVLHPGPMNRGVEINDDLADTGQCLVLDQVANGVATRMALLFLYLTRKSPVSGYAAG